MTMEDKKFKVIIVEDVKLELKGTVKSSSASKRMWTGTKQISIGMPSTAN